MRFIQILLLALVAATPAAAENAFDALAPFMGKTWRGAEDVEDSEHGYVIQRWEWILGGRAVRVSHANNGGVFGGVWTIYEDPLTGKLRSHYVGAFGSYSEGLLEEEDGSLVHEMRVTGAASLNFVRLVITPQEDGSFITNAEYFQNGEPLDSAPTFRYREAPGAELIIKPAAD